jgi:PHD/YefM family antitoxin component YafN of YafNO toxin-antitoxin module
MLTLERIKPYEAKRALTRLLNRVAYGHRPVIFEARGHDLAALISMKQLHVLQQALALREDEEDASEMRAALADPQNARRVAWRNIRDGTEVRSGDAEVRGKGVRAAPAPRKAADRGGHRRTGK